MSRLNGSMDRVAITGMGVLSPAGRSVPEFWKTLCEARAVYRPIPSFADDPQYRVKIGAQITEYSWAWNLPVDRYGKAACYCLYTAKQALDDAGLSARDLAKKRVGVIVGTTMGEIQEEETFTRWICGKGEGSAARFRKCYPAYHIAHAVAEHCRADGPCYVVPAACAAGNYAVAMAKQVLEAGYADILLVGGVDVFSRVAFAGFQRLLSLAPDCCRPFDRARKGLVLGEGCGFLVLEREGERMGKNHYGRILGAGLASNASHMTAPHKEGEGEWKAMHKAITDAGLQVDQVDYISAHGTGTRANDLVEARSIRRLFEGRKAPPVSSIKSALGHSMGAASILELIACCLMMRNNVLLPTIHYEVPDEECQLDVVPNKPREAAVRRLLSNSFAFGGQTSCLVLETPRC